ncbi:hypothetical protein JCM1841_006971 [Sporobolomyces salmonicolor]
MEIFSDDIDLLVKALKKIIPGSSVVKTGGEESKSDYGFHKVADFLAGQAKVKVPEVRPRLLSLPSKL